MIMEIELIKRKMLETLGSVEYITQLVDRYELNNEQFYLDWLDKLNEYSVRN